MRHCGGGGRGRRRRRRGRGRPRRERGRGRDAAAGVPGADDGGYSRRWRRRQLGAHGVALCGDPGGVLCQGEAYWVSPRASCGSPGLLPKGLLCGKLCMFLASVPALRLAVHKRLHHWGPAPTEMLPLRMLAHVGAGIPATTLWAWQQVHDLGQGCGPV